MVAISKGQKESQCSMSVRAKFRLFRQIGGGFSEQKDYNLVLVYDKKKNSLYKNPEQKFVLGSELVPAHTFQNRANSFTANRKGNISKKRSKPNYYKIKIIHEMPTFCLDAEKIIQKSAMTMIVRISY